MLLHSSASDSIFLTWEWMQSWRTIVESKIRPFIVTVRDDEERLVGLAPFYHSKLLLFGVINYKTLRFFSDYATGSEYPDWIVAPDYEKEANIAIAGALLKEKRQWDVIWMPKLSGWNGAIERITAALNNLGMLYCKRTSPFSSFSLPLKFEDYEKEFTSKRRKNLRRDRRKLLEKQGVEIKLCSEPSSVQVYLDDLFRLHNKRRLLLNDPGCFIRKPAEAEFYKKFVPIALEKGWLRFIALQQNNITEATQIGYVYNNEYLALQEGYNPEFFDGVGNVLRHISIEQCISDGLHSYDFLGGFSEHKRLWRAKKRDGYDLFIGRPTLKNRILFLKPFWPSGRFLKAEGLYDGN